MKFNQRECGLTVLRIGLAILYLWFGFSQLMNGIDWVSWVPDWAVSVLHLPPAMIVLLNGLFEVALGTLLAINIWVRWVAFILALHLFVIVLDIGASAIGVRDFSLAAATLALALLRGKSELPKV